MKKKILIISIAIGIVILLTVAVRLIFGRNMIEKTGNFLFYLDEKYYGIGAFVEITPEEATDLIENEESFAIYIHQPFCSTSYEFNKILTKFAEEYQISFYKISFDDMKETEMHETIQYYPSFAIYKDGELIDYLDAESDEDLPRYKDAEEFAKWFGSYIQLKSAEE